MTIIVDTDVMQSIEYFIVYGIPPGAYAERLLALDPESEKYVHPVISKKDKSVHLGHVKIVETLPITFIGQNFYTWPGLTNIPRDQIKEIIFEAKMKGCKFMEMILREYSDDLKLDL